MAANSNETEARILNYIKYLYDRTNKYITGYVNKDELCRIIMLHPSIYSERAIVLVCRVAYCVFLLQCICSKNVFLCFRHRFISPYFSFRSLVYILSIHFSLGSLTFSSTYFISLIYFFPLSFLCILYSLILSILSNFLLFHIFLSYSFLCYVSSCNLYMCMYVCVYVYDIAQNA